MLAKIQIIMFLSRVFIHLSLKSSKAVMIPYFYFMITVAQRFQDNDIIAISWKFEKKDIWGYLLIHL